VGFKVPLFGDGRLVRVDHPLPAESARAPSSDAELAGVLPGRALLLDRDPHDDSAVRARRGNHGAAKALVDQYAKSGVSISMEAARSRVAVARTRAAARKESR